MRKTKLVVCGAIAAVVLTACGHGSGDKQNDQGGNAAAAPAKDVPTLVKNVSSEVKAKHTAKLDMKITAGGHDVTGTGAIKIDGKDVASDLKLSGKDTAGPGEVIVLDGVTYLKNSGKSASGKPWAKLDPKGNNPLAKLLQQLSQPSQQYADPTKMFGQLSVGGKLTKTSKEELNGQQTTHYSVRVNTNKIADSEQNPQLKQLMKLVARSGINNYPIDIWVNGDNLPVRFTTKVPQPDVSGITGNQAKAPKIGPTTVTITYRDWGKPVQIKAPPANQVGELKLPDLSKQGGGH
ncbi:MAG: hypothetical protein ACRDQ5_10665 [Sciscionella sp.]